MQQYDVIIVGAGAAGLMCAIEAGKRGRKTLLLDHANKAGKKILMSGGGRCNFTNMYATPENYLSHNPNFCKSALSRYTPWHFIELVQQHKIAYHEKTLGQLFCDNKSKDILNLLLSECERYNVTIKLKTTIKSINAGFIVDTCMGELRADSVVIATGGLSIPTLGASPFGYKIAEQFDLPVHPTRAGLVPFTLHEHDKQRFADLSGVSQECVVSCNGQRFRESMLFTHRGLSGPAMLQISSYWRAGDTLLINLLPDSDLLALLITAKQDSANQLVKTCLLTYFPKRLLTAMLAEDILAQRLQNCSHKQLETIAHCFTAWEVVPNATEGYRTAEVTLGGVDCDVLSSKTFEVSKVPGLYFIGETLDVSGWLGGYNFQWAWASGWAAGQVA
jgi:predicted Rossmann fold flavoprotein